MQTTLRFAPVPRVAWLLVILGLLIAVAATALWTVGSRPRLPAPFGPAANGVIAFGAANGDIHLFDPASGASRPLIVGAGKDADPVFSPDGALLAFGRQGEGQSAWQIVAADADGSHARPLTELIYPDEKSWSPDSAHLAVIDSALTIHSLDGSAAVALPIGMLAQRVQWRSRSELVFVGTKGPTIGLYVVATDGAAPRELLPPTTVDTDWLDPVVSPDGTRIVWTKWAGGPVIHILDIATGTDRVPVFDGSAEGDGWPTWSADGTRLLFSRWNGTENHLAVGPVGGGHVVETGPGFPDFTNGAVGVFSPDGTRIIAGYGNDPTARWILDSAGGPGQRILTDLSGDASWQRLAP